MKGDATSSYVIENKRVTLEAAYSQPLPKWTKATFNEGVFEAAPPLAFTSNQGYRGTMYVMRAALTSTHLYLHELWPAGVYINAPYTANWIQVADITALTIAGGESYGQDVAVMWDMMNVRNFQCFVFRQGGIWRIPLTRNAWENWTVGTPVLVANLVADKTDPSATISCRLGSSNHPNRMGAYYVASFYGNTTSDHAEIGFLSGNNRYRYGGYIPKATGPLDVVGLPMFGEEMYLGGYTLSCHVSDPSGKNPLHINTCWSSAYDGSPEETWTTLKPVLPMDSLDEDTSFKMISGTPFWDSDFKCHYLFARFRRKKGNEYLAMARVNNGENILDRFMIVDKMDAAPGPHSNDTRFTAYRYQKQQPYTQVGHYGTLGVIAPYDFMFICGFGITYVNPPWDSLVPESWKSQPINVSAEYVINGTDHMRLESPTQFLGEDPNRPPDTGANYDHVLDPGDKVILTIGAPYVTGQTTMGTYGVDIVERTQSAEGEKLSYDCTGWDSKLLTDWRCDTFFDIFGQAVTITNPAELTKMLRESGKWDGDDTLQLTSLNEDGIMFMVDAASKGCLILGNFKEPPGNNAVFGVGGYYGVETLAEASNRLGKPIEDIKTDDRMKYGVFAICNVDNTGEWRIKLYDYNTIYTEVMNPDNGTAVTYKAPWHLLGANTVAWHTTTEFVLGLHIQDGLAKLYYADATVPAQYIDLFGSVRALTRGDRWPSEYEHYGRGAIFMRHNTGYEAAYAFASDTDVIPFHCLARKLEHYGRSLEDITLDQFGSGPGTVLVDSEQITYKGVAKTRLETALLTYTPGKVIAKSVNTFDNITGADIAFANDRTRNYIIQELGTAIPNGYVTAVRFWVKKFNFPEDGITIALCEGPGMREGNIAKPLGNELGWTQDVVSGKITEEGKMITCFFSRPLQVSAGQRYRLVVARARNRTHPSAATYFATRAIADSSFSGGSAYLFREDTDEYTPINGDIPFQLFARTEELSSSYALSVLLDYSLPNSPVAPEYYNGMAAVIEEGGGIYNSWRVVGCRRSDADGLFTFLLDRDPGMIFDELTRVRVTKAFYGLTRGVNSTLAAAHGNWTKVHKMGNPLEITKVRYFSAEEDQSLAEVAGRLAYLAGVRKFWVDTLDNKQLWDYEDNTGEAPIYLYADMPNKQFVARFLLYRPLIDNMMHIYLRDKATQANKLTLLFYCEALPLLGRQLSILDGGGNTLYYMNHGEYFFDIRISVYNGYISVWNNGHPLGGCELPEGFAADEIGWEIPVDYGVCAMLPKANSRVDYFSFDAGRTGTDLLRSLIGEKRIYVSGGSNGIRLITETTPATNSLGNPINYDMPVEYHEIQSDVNLATRLMAEGGEVAEVDDVDYIKAYGNLFKSANFSEINTLEDAMYFAQKALLDLKRNARSIQFSGPFCPTYEPMDELNVKQKDGTYVTIMIDRIDAQIGVSETDATDNMNISGRIP